MESLLLTYFFKRLFVFDSHKQCSFGRGVFNEFLKKDRLRLYRSLS